MLRSRLFGLALGLVAVLAAPLPAHAAMAVVDIRAISQLITQIRTLRDQLSVAQSQLTQAQNEYRAMTGARGMEQLLANAPRNYLPTNWADFEAAARQAGGAYQQLAAQIEAAIMVNAILTPAQIAALSVPERDALEAARRSAAMLVVTAQQALATTSGRFAALQELIDAIPAAQDQKAILDLQARISAEQGMLANEQTKLHVLFQGVQAEEWARRQRTHEQAIANIGSLRRLPAMGL